jgi:hypothetical protein
VWPGSPEFYPSTAKVPHLTRAESNSLNIKDSIFEFSKV